jgi:hypothetical protein
MLHLSEKVLYNLCMKKTALFVFFLTVLFFGIPSVQAQTSNLSIWKTTFWDWKCTGCKPTEVSYSINPFDIKLNYSDKNPVTPTIVGNDYYVDNVIGKQEFDQTGNYILTLEHDNGLTIYLDNKVIYTSNTYTTAPKQIKVWVTAGTHDVELKHWQDNGPAYIHAKWEYAAQ